MSEEVKEEAEKRDLLEQAFYRDIDVECADGTVIRSDPIKEPPSWPNYRDRPAMLDWPSWGERKEQEIPLQPWGGPRRYRLDRQAEDVRRKITNPRGFVLAHEYKNYYASSMLMLVWLYLKGWFSGLFHRNPWPEHIE